MVGVVTFADSTQIPASTAMNHKPPFRFATIPSGTTEENIKINFPEMAAYMRAFNRTTVVEGLKSLKSEQILCSAFICWPNEKEVYQSVQVSSMVKSNRTTI
ncbi:hypothetical protein ACTXT7_012160 [Hymenolepis weldensis]